MKILIKIVWEKDIYGRLLHKVTANVYLLWMNKNCNVSLLQTIIFFFVILVGVNMVKLVRHN